MQASICRSKKHIPAPFPSKFPPRVICCILPLHAPFLPFISSFCIYFSLQSNFFPTYLLFLKYSKALSGKNLDTRQEQRSKEFFKLNLYFLNSTEK
jgi:hypothetical protein